MGQKERRKGDGCARREFKFLTLPPLPLDPLAARRGVLVQHMYTVQATRSIRRGRGSLRDSPALWHERGGGAKKAAHVTGLWTYWGEGGEAAARNMKVRSWYNKKKKKRREDTTPGRTYKERDPL